jgi:hypothetical protein
LTISRYYVTLRKTKERLIKQLKPGHEITVIFDTPHGFHSLQTTAAKLVAAKFGEKKLTTDDEDFQTDEDDATLILNTLEDYNLIKAVDGGGLVSSVMGGRPKLAENDRASQQLQIRVTALQKEAYAKAADDYMLSVSEWAKRILDAAAKKPCYAA